MRRNPRPVGRQSLERSVRALIAEAERYAQSRALTASDALWAMALAERLTRMLKQEQDMGRTL